MKMHHSQATFLRLRRIEFVIAEGSISTTNTTPAFSADSAKALIEQIKAHEKEAGKELRGKGLGDRSGVMVKHYHDEYTANGGGNGDLLDETLRSELVTDDGIDVIRLKNMAKAHDVWDAKYEALNPGMARMNVANRLRAKIRKEGALDIFGVEIGEGDLKARVVKPKAEKKTKRKAKAEAVEQVAA